MKLEFKNCVALLSVIILVTCVIGSSAQNYTFSFSNIYGDHMVLQQAPHQANLWGFIPGCASVTVSFDGKNISATVVQVNRDLCKWSVILPATAADSTKSYKITATESSNHWSITLSDVLFGDVWLCSGQSNMELAVSQVFNATEEMAKATNYPHIRLFTAALISSEYPVDELLGVQQVWSVPTPVGLVRFSAACWFFGQNLYDDLKYPIGLVATDWGGTPIEAWSSPDALAKCKKEGLVSKTEENTRHEETSEVLPRSEKAMAGPSPNTPSVLWNAMIHPFLYMTIKGAIWYQGEANAGAPYTYNCTFPAMIDDWREKWYTYSMKQTDPLMGFGFVQLSADGTTNVTVGGFPVIRWAQTANYGYVPNNRMKNVFMAVAMDLGDPNSPLGSIHPRDKQDVGARLALSARAVVYTEKIVDYQGPVPVSAEMKRNPGSVEVTVTFRTMSSLELRYPYGFELCCSSKATQPQWIEGTAMSAGVETVVVGFTDCPSGTSPDMIRYCWRTDPCTFKKCPVYAKDSELPAGPFVLPLS